MPCSVEYVAVSASDVGVKYGQRALARGCQLYVTCRCRAAGSPELPTVRGAGGPGTYGYVRLVRPWWRCARSRHELPNRQVVGEPPRAPRVVPLRRGRLTSSAPCFTPSRGWSAASGGATGPYGAITTLSARGAAAAAVFRAALGRKRRASRALRRARPGDRYAYKFEKCGYVHVPRYGRGCGVLHSPHSFYN